MEAHWRLPLFKDQKLFAMGGPNGTYYCMIRSVSRISDCVKNYRYGLSGGAPIRARKFNVCVASNTFSLSSDFLGS